MPPTLRDRILTRRVAEAMMSPSAVLLAGAGASLAIVTGLGPIAAAAMGVAAWAARVAGAVGTGPRRQRVDPRAVDEPWRRFVDEALQARVRFEKAVGMTQTGPLRDRLLEIASRVDTGIDEVWRIARQGHAIVEARSHLEVESIRRELAAAEDDAGERWAVGSALPRTVEALRSQLEAAERMDRVIADAHSRLRLLDARLDEAVARALELSVQADRPDDLTGLHADVDVLVTEMEALRRALEETSGGNRATDTM